MKRSSSSFSLLNVGDGDVWKLDSGFHGSSLGINTPSRSPSSTPGLEAVPEYDASMDPSIPTDPDLIRQWLAPYGINLDDCDCPGCRRMNGRHEKGAKKGSVTGKREEKETPASFEGPLDPADIHLDEIGGGCEYFSRRSDSVESEKYTKQRKQEKLGSQNPQEVADFVSRILQEASERPFSEEPLKKKRRAPYYKNKLDMPQSAGVPCKAVEKKKKAEKPKAEDGLGVGKRKGIVQYWALAGLALLNGGGPLASREIYRFVAYYFPYCTTGIHWMNSIRHELCKNEHFKAVSPTSANTYTWDFVDLEAVAKFRKDLEDFEKKNPDRTLYGLRDIGYWDGLVRGVLGLPDPNLQLDLRENCPKKLKRIMAFSPELAPSFDQQCPPDPSPPQPAGAFSYPPVQPPMAEVASKEYWNTPLEAVPPAPWIQPPPSSGFQRYPNQGKQQVPYSYQSSMHPGAPAGSWSQYPSTSHFYPQQMKTPCFGQAFNPSSNSQTPLTWQLPQSNRFSEGEKGSLVHQEQKPQPAPTTDSVLTNEEMEALDWIFSGGNAQEKAWNQGVVSEKRSAESKVPVSMRAEDASVPDSREYIVRSSCLPAEELSPDQCSQRRRRPAFHPLQDHDYCKVKLY